MKIINIIYLFFIFYISLSIAKENIANNKNNINPYIPIFLDDNNFEIFTQNNNVLVLFYSSKTPKFLLKAFSSASKELSELKCEYKLAKINMDIEKNTLEKYKIKSPVTMKLFRKGYVSNYEGKYDKDGIKNFCLKKEKIMLKEIHLPENFTKAYNDNIKNKGIMLVYWGNNKIKHNALTRALYKYENDNNFNFYYCNDILTITSVGKMGTITLYKTYDNFNDTLKDKITEEKIYKFIEDNAYPLVSPMDSRVYNEIFSHKIPYFVLFQKNNEETDEIKLIHKKAEKYKGKMKFAFSQIIGGPQQHRLSKLLSIIDYELPCAGIFDSTSGNMKKYKLDKNITNSRVDNFINDFYAHNLVPIYRSKILYNRMKGNVLTLVGNTFKKEVLDNDKDVFIIFTTPYCEHCKNDTKIISQLADYLKDNKKLVIAEFDTYDNEYEGININVYPSFYLYKGDEKNKKPYEFIGSRTISSFVYFLKNRCYNKIIIPETIKDKDKDKNKDKDKDKDKNKSKDKINTKDKIKKDL